MDIINSSGHPLYIWGKGFDSGTLNQLKQLAEMPYIFKHVAAMPDAHVGIGATIGSVFASDSAVVPSAVGVDIGCGMRAIRTNILAAEISVDKLQRFVDVAYSRIPLGFESHNSEQKWEGIKEFPLNDKDLKKKAAMQIGTLGGGNHFIEIQTDGEFTWIMIHTGSRHVGLQIAEHYIRAAKEHNTKHKTGLPFELSFLPLDENIGKEYLAAMDWTLAYARENRRQLLDRVLEIFAETISPAIGIREDIEIHHNFAAFEKHFNRNVMVHRKGATRAYENELGIIPGSMGTPSYITRGLGNPDSFMSSSHGAGRRMSRKAAQKQISMEDFNCSMKGIAVMLKKSMLDEAPQAYKNIDDIMTAQQDLVVIVYKLKPLANIKG